MKKRVGIIGGGAAGLFSACLLKKFSGNEDIDVTILEKNSVLGKKLMLTGTAAATSPTVRMLQN